MTRKILYIIATAWVLAFISQTYAHAADQWSYFECKSPFYRYTEISFGEDYGGSATIFTNFAVTHTTKGGTASINFKNTMSINVLVVILQQEFYPGLDTKTIMK